MDSSKVVHGLAIALVLAGCGGPAAQQCPETPRAPEPAAATHEARPGKGQVDVGSSTRTDNVFKVQIAKDGELLIDGHRLADKSELTQAVRTSARARSDLQVLLLAERDVSFAHVATAIELVKQGGVTRMSFAIDYVGPPPGPVTAVPLKSLPSLEAGTSWRCSIQQSIDNLEKLSAFVRIHIGPGGDVQTVDVLEDPGYGLGDAAKACAFNQKFRAATDPSGNPVAGALKLRVYFQRGG